MEVDTQTSHLGGNYPSKLLDLGVFSEISRILNSNVFVMATVLQFWDEMVEKPVFKDEKGEQKFLVSFSQNRK